MALSLEAKTRMSMVGSVTNTPTGASDSFSEVVLQDFADGVSADQARRSWEDERTLGTGANETIDLFDFGTLDIGGGAGLDSLGQALALTGIKCLLIQNKSTSVGNLIVGGDGTTAAWNSLFNGSDTAELLLPPDSAVMVTVPTAAGMAVADTTNHLLKMTDSGGGCTYSVHLIGI